MRALWRWMRGLCLAIGIAWLLVTFTPLTRWYAQALSGPWQQPQGDVLIVLGADQPSYGYIGLASYWRSVYAVRAWREGTFRTVVISGGRGVAESMKEFMVFSGVPAANILTETRSESTRENALFTAPILKSLPGRKVLLTSDFHVYRGVGAFRKAGIDVAPEYFPYAAKRVGNWLDRWPLFLELNLETLKIVVYRVRGWI